MIAPLWTPEPLGDAAVRFALPSGCDPRAILEALQTTPRVTDVVVTERHVCVHFDPEHRPDDLECALNRAMQVVGAASERPCTSIRARYDGPDLDVVARFAGTSVDAVIAVHASREYIVRVVGFMPGFAYLGEVDPRIAAPRLRTPRAKVAALSIGVAGERTGVYPFASPGGWNLIATAVDFEAFNASRGAALALGDRVRFVPA